MTDREIVLDGFLDDEIALEAYGAAARFRIVAATTDERVDEAVLPCSVTDPVMARAVLDLQHGDHLRVTGYLRLPTEPDSSTSMSLQVHRIEVLATAPLLHLAADADQAGTEPDPENTAVPVIDRYADYLTLHDTAGRTHIWHESGAAVGDTDDPAAVGDLIEAYERHPGKD